MKRLIFLFAVILVSVTLGQAQDKTEKKNDSKKAVMLFKKGTTHDYGTIKRGSDGSCEFVFKNTGKETLVLTDVKSSCGCTVPSWPKQPVKPGKEAKIKVSYDTNRIGHFSKSITVYSNAKNSPVVLIIKGEVSQQ